MDAETAAQFETLLVLVEGALALAQRRRTKAPADDDADVKRLIAIGGAAVAALAAQYHADRIDREQFLEQAMAALRDHAQTAASIGAAQFDGEADDDRIDELVDEQGDYLGGFADDIDDRGMSAEQIAARAALYGGVIWVALQMGKGDGAAASGIEQCWWDLDPGAQHCDDCPDLADGSPYAYPDELPTYPGQDVQCQSNCRCALRFEGEGDGEEEGKAPDRVLVKEAHCVGCHRWLGRNVNADAILHCPGCKETRIVPANAHTKLP